jgi:disulfide bond formation protein DsbB
VSSACPGLPWVVERFCFLVLLFGFAFALLFNYPITNLPIYPILLRGSVVDFDFEFAQISGRLGFANY